MPFACKLKFFEVDTLNWNHVATGFLTGLYRNPPSTCSKCDSFGVSVANINLGYIGLQAVRDTWINFNNLISGNPFQIVGNMITIVTLFINMYYHVDQIFKDSFIMKIPILVTQILA